MTFPKIHFSIGARELCYNIISLGTISQKVYINGSDWYWWCYIRQLRISLIECDNKHLLYWIQYK